MGFNIHPEGARPPLEVAPDTASMPQAMAECADVTAGAMFIVVNGVDERGNGEVMQAEPTFTLRVAPSSVALSATSPSGELSDPFGNRYHAALTREAATNLWMVRLTVVAGQFMGNVWFLSIGSAEAAPRRFVWAVADSPALAAQPWINAPATLDFDTTRFQDGVLTGALRVTNFGTGVLTIPEQTVANPAFRLQGLPLTIPPNKSRDLMVRCDYIGRVGEPLPTIDHWLESNDSVAQAGPKTLHNAVVRMSVTGPGAHPA